jgi:cysteinyl-tRNA synthetase
MIDMIQSLVEQEFAYESNGSVFFRVRKYNEYGKLSGKNIDDLVSGARVEVDSDKEDPLDFALWKASKPGEPKWESPWGEGRPGWHIECSVMSKFHLGETFDIHAGGSDLIFPHHENEIAQSECANGKTYANYWMHNGMIKIQSQKMSKSLGNFATIKDLVKQYNPELIRFFTLSSQYRQSIDFNKEALAKSGEGLDRIYGGLEKYTSTVSKESESAARENGKVLEQYRSEFLEAMCDDLNTPKAIAVIFDLIRKLNTLDSSSLEAADIYHTILYLGKILGLLQTPADQWFKTPRIMGEEAVEDGLGDAEIDDLIAKREQARSDKDWALADSIRDQLQAASIHIEDRDGKTVWRRK